MGSRRPGSGHHGPQFDRTIPSPIREDVRADDRRCDFEGTGPAGPRGRPRSASADLHAHYYLLVAVGFNTQQFGQFLPAVPEWGIPPFAGGNQAYEIISTGSIVLDLISTSAKRIIWRGIAQAEIDSEKTDEQRHARIREAVHDLVLKYPKKK